MVSFTAEELHHGSDQWKIAIIGKFLSKGFPLNFIQKELKIRRAVEGDFQEMPLSEGLLLFSFPSTEIRDGVLTNGPWSLAGQLLAMEAWRPSFKPGKDQLKHVSVYIHLPDLPLELWDKEMLMKIMIVAGKPLFLDNWTERSTRMEFARLCVQLDLTKPICSGTKIEVNDSITWQEFIYEDLPDICYHYGKIGVVFEVCGCIEAGDMAMSKLLLGPWIKVSRVSVVVPTSPSTNKSRSPTPPSEATPHSSHWSQPKKSLRKKSPSSPDLKQVDRTVVTGTRFGPLFTVEPQNSQLMGVAVESPSSPQKKKCKRFPTQSRGTPKSPGSESPQRKVVDLEDSEPMQSEQQPKSLSLVSISPISTTKKEVWRVVSTSPKSSSSSHVGSSSTPEVKGSSQDQDISTSPILTKFIYMIFIVNWLCLLLKIDPHIHLLLKCFISLGI
ncbi:uncharacterized protein [Elaeis guineensis]|uniref:uncharacterized protein n=1 Tax=Elaeis guineensis var. tenera TaxID=51953 RepID=UPI003C6D2B70